LCLAGAVLAATATWGRAAPEGEASGDVVVVANRGWPVATVTRTDLENIFLGRKTQMGDKRVTFAVLKGGAAHERFLRDCVGKTEAQFKNYWKQMVFTGKGSAPMAFDTEAELLRYIAATDGAIGYVGAGAKFSSDQVKRVAVQ
jgi:ABC-type phosphate transport system substrate-binding protein